MSLENRSYLLENGYLDVGDEVADYSTAMSLLKKIHADMIKMYALTQINQASASELLHVTTEQWKAFTHDSGDWLGNCVNDGG